MSQRIVTVDDASAQIGGSLPAAVVGLGYYTPGYISGQYYFCNSYVAPSTSTGLSFNAFRCSPWVVHAPITITRLFAEHTLAQTGTSLRLGIYTHSPSTGLPGSLLLDAGTIDTSAAAAVHELTVSQALPPGMYWVGGACQGSGTSPTVRVGNPNGSCVGWGIPLGSSLPTAGLSTLAVAAAGVSGALPSTLTSAFSTITFPRVGFKVA